MEYQARLIASAPRLHAIAREVLTLVADHPEDAPPALTALAQKVAAIERYLQEAPATTPKP
jgi:AraC-like DNA-binding protein